MKKIFSLLAITGFLASMFSFALVSKAEARGWGWNRWDRGSRHNRCFRNRCFDRCDWNRCGNNNWWGGCSNNWCS